MADPFIGEIRAFAFDYAPKDWAICAGQFMPISQNNALFSVLGVQFGGNGTTNFALPNFQGMAPMGAGTGTGLKTRTLGVAVGKSSETLSEQQVPGHSHTIGAQASAADKAAPSGLYLAQGARGSAPRTTSVPTYAAEAPTVPLANGALAPSVGGSQTHSNMQPYLALSFCICLFGTFPNRG